MWWDDEFGEDRIFSLYDVLVVPDFKNVSSLDYPYVFKSEVKNDKKVLNKLDKVEIVYEKASKIYFTSKKMKSLLKKYDKYKSKLDDLMEDYFQKFVNWATSYNTVLDQFVNVISKIDILSSFAILAKEKQYVRPKVASPRDDQYDRIVIKGGKHPMVEESLNILKKLSSSTPGDFIPNDLILKRNVDRFQIITGPNMGGKSTYLRQNALIILMAQIGCFVPCQEAEISIRDAIFTRIGANDNVLHGISTFKAEMMDAATILRGATSKSFVIIDELGRGTSHDEGFCLAKSITENLVNVKQCWGLFATHFHEMVSVVDSCKPKGVVGVMQMGYSYGKTGKNITLTYNISRGSCLASFGFEVAKRTNFPKVVIDKALTINEQIKSLKEKDRNVMKVEILQKEKLEREEKERKKQELDDVIRNVLRVFGKKKFEDIGEHKEKETEEWLKVLVEIYKKIYDRKDDGTYKRVRNLLKLLEKKYGKKLFE